MLLTGQKESSQIHLNPICSKMGPACEKAENALEKSSTNHLKPTGTPDSQRCAEHLFGVLTSLSTHGRDGTATRPTSQLEDTAGH